MVTHQAEAILDLNYLIFRGLQGCVFLCIGVMGKWF